MNFFNSGHHKMPRSWSAFGGLRNVLAVRFVFFYSGSQ